MLYEYILFATLMLTSYILSVSGTVIALILIFEGEREKKVMQKLREQRIREAREEVRGGSSVRESSSVWLCA